MSLKGDKKEQVLLHEYDILHTMHHPNIVRIYSLINFRNFVIISMKLGIESVEDYLTRRIAEGKPLLEDESA